jgi:di/tricarboxylate transporter
MDLAWLSLSSLVVAILVSCFTDLNVGILSLAFAWIIGVYFGGMPLNDVFSGFPVQLFLTLAGVTLLFSQAQLNGTLEKLAHQSVKICRGNVGLIPVMFFALACGIASLGPGNISTAALLAPIALVVGTRAQVPPFLMALMVGNGAQAGSLSPFAPTGIIVNGLMDRINLAGYEWPVYWTNLVAHSSLAFAAYFAFGGLGLFRLTYSAPADQTAETTRFDRGNWVTLGVIGVLMSSVLFFGVHVGMGAFAGAAVLAMFGIADHREAIRKMPWPVIVMVSGVTVLIAIMEKTQGLDLFTALLARFATAETVTGLIAFLTGVISVYSSTSGVVLPAFLPTVPGLIERLGGGDMLGIALSMNVGAHLVDMSPLSTTGALCLAAVPASEDVRGVYNKLLAWGLSMCVVGALWCWLFF